MINIQSECLTKIYIRGYPDFEIQNTGYSLALEIDNDILFIICFIYIQYLYYLPTIRPYIGLIRRGDRFSKCLGDYVQ